MKRKLKGDTLMLFLAILAVVSVTLLSFMTFLPSPDEGSPDHPMASVNFAGRKAELQLRVHQSIEHLREKKKPRYYMVFSTSCSPFQHWQALAFFHFAKKVKQPGNVTRLVSGCTPEELVELEKYHAERIAPLSPSFSMHATPDYGAKNNQKYWNKPKGLLNFMEKALGFPENAEAHKDDIIMIVDPDMMLLRPITHEVGNIRTEWNGRKRTNNVVHGIPVAQKYAYGSAWLTSLNGNLSYVVGPKSPALEVSVKDAALYYPAGPPYMATGSDMYAIANHWVKFLPRVHDIFPGFMAEMHAYSVAAAHLKLPHQLADGFMVSDVSGWDGRAAGQEGFGFLDNTTRGDVCVPNKIPMDQMPLVLHYCQRYSLGRWFFSKYKLREDFFTCEAPLLREPPPNLGEIYDWNIFPNEIDMLDMSTPRKEHLIILHGWMLCTILYSLNEIAADVKKLNCGADANYSKVEHFHDNTKFQAMLDDPSNPFKNGTIATA